MLNRLRLLLSFVPCLIALMCVCLSCKSSGAVQGVSHSEVAVMVRVDTIQTHDTIRLESEVRDSIIVRTQNDTTYIERWRDRINIRDRAVASSSVKVIRDTVSKTDTIKAIREIPAKLTAAQKRFIAIGKWAVCLIFAAFALFIVWLLKKTSK